MDTRTYLLDKGTLLEHIIKYIKISGVGRIILSQHFWTYQEKMTKAFINTELSIFTTSAFLFTNCNQELSSLHMSGCSSYASPDRPPDNSSSDLVRSPFPSISPDLRNKWKTVIYTGLPVSAMNCLRPPWIDDKVTTPTWCSHTSAVFLVGSRACHYQLNEVASLHPS